MGAPISLVTMIFNERMMEGMLFLVGDDALIVPLRKSIMCK